MTKLVTTDYVILTKAVEKTWHIFLPETKNKNFRRMKIIVRFIFPSDKRAFTINLLIVLWRSCTI